MSARTGGHPAIGAGFKPGLNPLYWGVGVSTVHHLHIRNRAPARRSPYEKEGSTLCRFCGLRPPAKEFRSSLCTFLHHMGDSKLRLTCTLARGTNESGLSAKHTIQEQSATDRPQSRPRCGLELSLIVRLLGGRWCVWGWTITTQPFRSMPYAVAVPAFRMTEEPTHWPPSSMPTIVAGQSAGRPGNQAAETGCGAG